MTREVDRPPGGRHAPQNNEWSDWLLHVREADDPAYERVVRSVVETYADRVLDHARLSPGMTLVDIGTGDGVLAFRAIERDTEAACAANSPHPWAARLRRILAEQFDPEERTLFEQMVWPTVESGKNIATDRSAYLSARKPPH